MLRRLELVVIESGTLVGRPVLVAGRHMRFDLRVVWQEPASILRILELGAHRGEPRQCLDEVSVPAPDK